ncbi:hypothetical protein PN36_34980 [Candidatus Thiomargarita nelsonii]|uniref:Uncharacterized protein n=1 Tax=Candidatus Thiomargarita nelsonii TaxID=1003181 RepID=A0A4E0QJL0_9GAMM|nr:hypothetical protein PN36_34980 [Candidatus Thiomargarita nelsonii]
MMQLAEDRQREIFEEMISSNAYLPPEELEDHDNMLAFALQYLMTTEFKYLEKEHKNLIRQHVKDRAKLSGQEKPPVIPVLPPASEQVPTTVG